MGGGSATRKEQMLVFGFPRAASTHDGREKLFVPPSNDGAYGVWMPVRCKKNGNRAEHHRETAREKRVGARGGCLCCCGPHTLFKRIAEEEGLSARLNANRNENKQRSSSSSGSQRQQ